MKTALKIAGAFLAALAVLALVPALLLAGFVASMREDTEVARVASPAGSRYAVVISSDHGATGGATYVDVVEAPTRILFFSVPGKTRRIYSGRWGEAQTLQVLWADEDTLLINGTPYAVPSLHAQSHGGLPRRCAPRNNNVFS